MGMAGKAFQSPRMGGFWGQLRDDEHAVQVYRDEPTFMDSLESFIATGLRSGESVVVIATASHLHEMEKRLRGGWIDLDRARWEDRYVAVLAQETLARFMVDGMPDEARFEATVAELILRARGRGRRIRAFGEMVDVLWSSHNKDAALRCEHLWSRVQAAHRFPLFCAYSRLHLGNDTESDIRSICAAHSRVVPGYV